MIKKNLEDQPWWYYFIIFGLVMYVFIQMQTMSYAPRQIVTQPVKYETVSIGKEQYEIEFKLKNISDTYDSNGVLSYTAEFESQEFPTVKIKCRIPSEKYDLLNTEAIYIGHIEYAYLEQYYRSLTEEQDNNELLAITQKYDSIHSAVKSNGFAKEVSAIDFLFSDYIISDIKNEDDILKDFESRYLAEDNNEERDIVKH